MEDELELDPALDVEENESKVVVIVGDIEVWVVLNDCGKLEEELPTPPGIVVDGNEVDEPVKLVDVTTLELLLLDPVDDEETLTTVPVPGEDWYGVDVSTEGAEEADEDAELEVVIAKLPCEDGFEVVLEVETPEDDDGEYEGV